MGKKKTKPKTGLIGGAAELKRLNEAAAKLSQSIEDLLPEIELWTSDLAESNEYMEPVIEIERHSRETSIIVSSRPAIFFYHRREVRAFIRALTAAAEELPEDTDLV